MLTRGYGAPMARVVTGCEDRMEPNTLPTRKCRGGQMVAIVW